MDYEWTVEHFYKVATQVVKRWEANPASLTPAVMNGRGGRQEHDFRYIHIKDIDLMVYTTGPGNRDTRAYIHLKDHSGGVDRPGFFDRKRRAMFDQAVDMLQRVQHEMQHGVPSLGDKLLCDAFPELFEEYLNGKAKKD